MTFWNAFRLPAARRRAASSHARVRRTAAASLRSLVENLEGRVLLSGTLSDGGFETVSVGAGGYQYDPSGSAWNFNGYAGLSGNGEWLHGLDRRPRGLAGRLPPDGRHHQPDRHGRGRRQL